MDYTTQLIQACRRNVDLYPAHHLHLTFDESIGESLYESLRHTNTMTVVDLPLGNEKPELMFARVKPQYLTTIVFASTDMLLDNLAMLRERLAVDSLNGLVLGWKLEGLVMNGKLPWLDRRHDKDFCYIEHHEKFPNVSLTAPLPQHILALDTVPGTATAAAAANPLSDTPILWSYSRKNGALMTARRVYRREDLVWFTRNVPKYEVCYYEHWCVDHEAEWRLAQEQLRRGRGC